MKCSNPECEASFDYREGRLVRISRAPSNGQPAANHSLIEHFWLCGNCAEQYVFERNSEMNVNIKPRDQRQPENRHPETRQRERRSIHPVAVA